MKTAKSQTPTELTRYRAKRDFTRTAEPAGDSRPNIGGHRYLIQKHAARRLHYDFRLELGGVLKSWAVTRGPSLDPRDKRLAVHVEDHPLSYSSFEGTIPQGQYGGGTVMMWDEGTWEPLGDAERDYARGNLSFRLDGKRLKGHWRLIRLRGGRSGDAKRDNWLLVKGKDDFADASGDAMLEKYTTSVVTRRGMEAIARAGGKKTMRKPAKANRAQKARPTPSPPAFVEPQLATLVSAPPNEEGWVHEIKFDGYRLLAVVANSIARVFTRAGNDWSGKFASLCQALGKLRITDAVIDGEAVNANPDGTFSFHALQDALSRGKLDRLRYYGFDLLHLNGVDLRARPLTERKRLLHKLLRGAPELLSYSEHFSQPGDKMLAHACSLALEGIVSKQANAPYRSGRSGSWLKSKCVREQEFVIGGYTEQPKHRGVLGALLIGYYDKERLQFAGKVGTGFSAREGTTLLGMLKARGAQTSPFATLPTDARRGAHFVNPELVAHVNFGEWTPDGKLRHPSFQELREDKPAREVSREKERDLGSVGPSKARRRRS